MLAGKVIVDCTNPVGPGMTHGLRSVRSGAEVLQSSTGLWYVWPSKVNAGTQRSPFGEYGT